MNIITTTKDLKEFCKECKNSQYLAIDTEFIRRSTYYAILCLIQVNNGKRCVAIDPFEVEDLRPFYKLINHSPKIVKIFHAANQDLEIFFRDSKKIPSNIFDTQIAARVCGFDDSVGYSKLVEKICKKTLEKQYQSSDWKKRPLNKKQVAYALHDVEYLPEIYFYLKRKIEKNKRKKWIAEEIKILEDKNTYKVKPRESWKKIKTRAKTPSYLAILKELASTREKIAEKSNIPKTFILNDEKLLSLSLLENPTPEDLMKKFRLNEEIAKKFVIALKKGQKTKESNYPSIQRRKKTIKPLEYMLKLILSMVSEDLKVASSVIASGDDLADLASRTTDKNNPCLSGWKYDVFGKYVKAVKAGKVKIGLDKKGNMRIFNER